MPLRCERLEDRDTPAAFNYGANPIDGFYSFDTADGRPIPGWTGHVQQALADVNADGFADAVYLAGEGGSGRAVAYSGAPGGGDVLFDKLILGDPAYRGGVSHAEGYDADGDGVPDTLVAAPGVGGGAVLAVIGPEGSRQLAVGPEDYRAGVRAMDGYRPAGSTTTAVVVILDGGLAPVLVAADVATGRTLVSVYLPPEYDTLVPAGQGRTVGGVQTFGVQVGQDAGTTQFLDSDGVRRRDVTIITPG